MTNYAIDDQHGNQIRGGIQSEDRARELAQQLANERGEAVALYSDDEPGSEAERIKPEADKNPFG